MSNARFFAPILSLLVFNLRMVSSHLCSELSFSAHDNRFSALYNRLLSTYRNVEGKRLFMIYSCL